MAASNLGADGDKLREYTTTFWTTAITSTQNSEIKQKLAKATSARTLHAQLENTIDDNDSLDKLSKAEGKKARALKVNQAVLNLICGTGIPPTVVDSNKWKHFIEALHVYSSTSFAETYIPAEALRVTEEAIKKLSKMKNLIISYDGGTTKHVESIYTIHVTTPDSRQSYLIEGSEKSGLSHTRPRIAKDIFEGFLHRLSLKSEI